MHWQDFLKATCALGVLWVLLEWSKALVTVMDTKIQGVEKRTQVVVHLVRASAISAAMCLAVWMSTIRNFVTHSSALAASYFFGIVAVTLGTYLAIIYGAAALSRRP